MPMNTEELLHILACPRCLSSLEALENNAQLEGLACAACAVVYPVRDAIPVMLLEEAVPRDQWDQGRREALGKGRGRPAAGQSTAQPAAPSEES